ncbi:MAG TPA: hypothetical protein VGI87_02570 [Solirubrobacteraceae bacterium]
MLHGGGLYSSFAGAQPPGVFVIGTVLEAIHDSLEWLRFAVACFQLGAGVIAGAMVLRITGSRVASILAVPLVLLTPWAVHEHGALTPELVALPVLLGAALAGAGADGGRGRLRGRGRGGSVLAGVLCGLLLLIKVPFVIPAIVVVGLSTDWRRAALWAVVVAVVGLALTWVLGGEGFWRDAVYAQTQSGSRTLGALKGFWAQALWNVIGLVVAAAIAVWLRVQAVDRRMLRMLLGLAAAMIVTFLTNFKEGTGLNITVPIEAVLVPLAVTGTVFAVRSPRAWLIGGMCAVAWLFTLAQSVSLITSPKHAQPFLRAGSSNAWYELMSASELRAAVAAARRCPDEVPYSGAPLIAFAAGRPMPGGQPDTFIIGHAPALHAFLGRVDAVARRCP